MFHRLKIALLSICFAGSFGAAALAQEGGLTLPDTPDQPVQFTLPELADTDDLGAVLQVFVGTPDACCSGKTAMAGRYTHDGARVTFDPAFDLVAGQAYTVRTVRPDLGAVAYDLTALLITPQVDLLAPEVIAVYPSGPDIPENTLRFYIYFSTPMTPHLSTEFIRLVDENGVADTAAFMTFKQELWNQDRTRLTLLMDPGRIKRGVAQNLTLGPALLEGNSYSIEVAGGWPSARGDQEAAQFVQSFEVSKALRTLPDTALWDVEAPAQSTRDPLVIQFDRPFDVSLAQSAITVLDVAGQRVDGTVRIEDHQTLWRFVPAQAWGGERVRIVVDARLEDVAGNNFRELLDHVVGTQVQDIDRTSFDVGLGPAP